MAGMPGILVVLDKIFVLTSLAGCVAWILEYTVNRGWRNSMGRTLLAKTSLLAGLLALSAVTFFVRPDRFWLLIIDWAGVGMLGLIGPVMAWRMLVFRRVRKAARWRQCRNGHQVTVTALFCPTCGVPVPPLPGLAGGDATDRP